MFYKTIITFNFTRQINNSLFFNRLKSDHLETNFLFPTVLGNFS